MNSTNSGRKLYDVLGDTIFQLYGQNNSCGKPLSISETLQRVLKLETDLLKWKRQLPKELPLQPCISTPIESEQAPIFERLNLIMTLRYLNTRVLLHRPVLTHFLRHIYDQNVDLEGNDFLVQCSRYSLQVCIDSAAEIISTTEKKGTRPYLLGAWWFTLYYSQSAQI